MTAATIFNVHHVDTVARLGPNGFEAVRRLSSSTPKPPPVRKARHLDAAAVQRIVNAKVDRELTPAIKPMVDKLQAMGRQLDRVKAHRDAAREAERTATPPAGYVRDAASGEVRRRTARDLAMANNAANGRDANGRRPGEPGYNFDGVAMVKAGATRQQINDAFWGRKT